MHFSDDQNRQIKDLARQFEENTGAEIVVTMVDKSDAYPEIPWKAFAMGVAMAALVLLAYALAGFNETGQVPVWRALALLLGTGAACAFLTLFWPALARLFLDPVRAEGETEQYAKSQFLHGELFGTPERISLLVLISRFERRVVILPDSGIQKRMAAHSFDAAIGLITGHLRQGNPFNALSLGLGLLEETLLAAGFKGRPGAPDLIDDEFVPQKGGGQ